MTVSPHMAISVLSGMRDAALISLTQNIDKLDHLTESGRSPCVLNQLMKMSGKLNPNAARIWICSATNPNKGGASKNTTKLIWASEAMFTAAGLSVSCAAADIASGKITAHPMPINVNPNNETGAEGEKVTSDTPINIKMILTLETDSGPNRATIESAKYRVTNWEKATQAKARPLIRGTVPNVSLI